MKLRLRQLSWRFRSVAVTAKIIAKTELIFLHTHQHRSGRSLYYVMKEDDVLLR